MEQHFIGDNDSVDEEPSLGDDGTPWFLQTPREEQETPQFQQETPAFELDELSSIARPREEPEAPQFVPNTTFRSDACGHCTGSFRRDARLHSCTPICIFTAEAQA